MGSAALCVIGGGLIYKVNDHPDYETYLTIFSTALATLTAVLYWNGRKCDALWGMGLLLVKSIALQAITWKEPNILTVLAGQQEKTTTDSVTVIDNAPIYLINTNQH